MAAEAAVEAVLPKGGSCMPGRSSPLSASGTLEMSIGAAAAAEPGACCADGW